MPAPYKRLGRIIKTHGTQGEVTVAPGDGLSFVRSAGLSVWVVPPPPGGAVPHTILDLRSGPKGPLVRLSGVEDAAGAHDLVGRWLLVAGDEAPELPEDDDVIGFEVVDATRGLLGSVTEVIVTGANDVWVVEGERFGQVLIPVIDQVVTGIDRSGRSIAVQLLEGLLEED